MSIPQGPRVVTADLDERELATILHALRMMQRKGPMLDRMEHFEECEPLSAEEIDNLCEQLNCA